MRKRLGFAGFLTVFQAVVLLGHAVIYGTWSYFGGPGAGTGLAVACGALACSFLGASLLAFRHTNPLLRVFYTVSAVWLGAATYLFLAAVACWIAAGAFFAAGVGIHGARLVTIAYSIALLAALYGVVNGATIRVRRVSVKLRNLPPSWIGRRAAFVSDLHVGHVRGKLFLEHIVRKIMRERPAAVLIGGDFFDGTAIDARAAAAPLASLSTPLGTYFVAGNHEEFRDEDVYLEALEAAGVRVLRNEKAEMDGLQLAGVAYRDGNEARRFARVLEQMQLDARRASVLLVHAPNQLWVSEPAGISLQLSGHTHRGQYFPFTWFAQRIYRQFSYGLSRLGGLQAYVSSGAGTWGPPLRVGSSPEIVMIEFQVAHAEEFAPSVAGSEAATA
jgi:predicted MPP superfamily phosphohydrolase